MMQQIWYEKHSLSSFLLPLAWVFRGLIKLRHLWYQLGVKKITHFKVPVIIIGNIVVGGTGKTPFLLWFASQLKRQGWRPGIVSRGYGGHAPHYPFTVQPNSLPQHCGDEPLLLARKTQCPVVVAPKRTLAVQSLIEQYNCDIILSDDGLQHYALGRMLEIVIIDGERGLGNQRLLPAGPLREPKSRLNGVDAIIYQGTSQSGKASFHLSAQRFVQVGKPHQQKLLFEFGHSKVHAVAGIGHPKRFFKQLMALGLDVIEHIKPDHHDFSPDDIQFADDLPVIMTEKDAVKCETFANANHWFLQVETVVDKQCHQTIQQLLQRINNNG